jgi:hypothetical protein
LKGLSIRVIKSYKNKIPSETKWKKASLFLEENKQKAASDLLALDQAMTKKRAPGSSLVLRALQYRQGLRR